MEITLELEQSIEPEAFKASQHAVGHFCHYNWDFINISSDCISMVSQTKFFLQMKTEKEQAVQMIERKKRKREQMNEKGIEKKNKANV